MGDEQKMLERRINHHRRLIDGLQDRISAMESDPSMLVMGEALDLRIDELEKQMGAAILLANKRTDRVIEALELLMKP